MTISVFSHRYERFREILVHLRKASGLTQVELAQRLNKPQSFVSKVERGERRIDVVELQEISEALGVDPVRVLSQFYKEQSD